MFGEKNWEFEGFVLQILAKWSITVLELLGNQSISKKQFLDGFLLITSSFWLEFLIPQLS